MIDLFGNEVAERNAVECDALISPCGRYRYWLSRTWDEGKPVVCFVMLNPSTADAAVDDPTIRRCIGFARGFGFGGLVVVNLFAWRATDPVQLTYADRPIGPENDDWIEHHVKNSACVICAWGACGKYDEAGREDGVVDELLEFQRLGKPVKCLGRTKAGRPRHPLYVKGDAVLLDFAPA